MKESELKKLLKKYQEGTASPVERYLVESWLESFQFDEGDEQLHTTPEASSALADSIISNVLKPDKKAATLLWKRVLSVAAIIIACLGIGFYYFSTNNVSNKKLARQQAFRKFSTGTNQLKSLQLPDSTIVYLNANSSIQITEVFNSASERKVTLNGEAFFEVKRDEKRPFKIQIGELQVKVLGTSFNVNGYEKVNRINVTVKTGKVQVTKRNEVLADLTPSQGLIYHKDRQDFELLVNSELAKAQWRDGVTVLDQANFLELSMAMYNTYGIQLHTQDKGVLNDQYNFTFRSSRTKAQTLNQLCELIGKKYRKEGNKVVIY